MSREERWTQLLKPEMSGRTWRISSSPHRQRMRLRAVRDIIDGRSDPSYFSALSGSKLVSTDNEVHQRGWAQNECECRRLIWDLRDAESSRNKFADRCNSLSILLHSGARKCRFQQQENFEIWGLDFMERPLLTILECLTSNKKLTNTAPSETVSSSWKEWVLMNLKGLRSRLIAITRQRDGEEWRWFLPQFQPMTKILKKFF